MAKKKTCLMQDCDKEVSKSDRYIYPIPPSLLGARNFIDGAYVCPEHIEEVETMQYAEGVVVTMEQYEAIRAAGHLDIEDEPRFYYCAKCGSIANPDHLKYADQLELRLCDKCYIPFTEAGDIRDTLKALIERDKNV